MCAQLWEMPLLGVGTVLRLERDAWSMVQMTTVRQAINENAAPSPPPPSHPPCPNASSLIQTPGTGPRVRLSA